MNSKSAKAASVTTRNGFLNTLNQLDGDQMVSAFNSARNRSKTQRFCQCGAEITRDEIILNNHKMCAACRNKVEEFEAVVAQIVTTPRRTFKCVPCKNCKSPFAVQKLVSDLMICRDCLRKAQEAETPAKRNRIIAEAVRNYTAALQRQICLGGRV